MPSLPSIAFEATSPSSVLDCSAVRLYAKLTENCEILKSVNQITSQKKKVCKKGLIYTTSSWIMQVLIWVTKEFTTKNRCAKLVTLITRLNATVDNGRKPFPKCRRYLVVLSLRFCG